MRKILSLSLACLMAVPATVQTQAQDIPEYCLENEVTHRFLTEVQYVDGDYSYTEITNYYQIPTDYRKDQPAPVRLEWTLDKSYDEMEIVYIESGSRVQKEILIDNNSTSYDIYNLVPGKTYTYQVLGSITDDKINVDVLKSGQFKTTGTVRMLKVDGVYNVRDLGGWTGFQGRMVPYGKLFRGGRLRNNSSNTVAVKEQGVQALLSEGIGLEIDLRTDSEANNNNQSPLGSDVKYIRYNDAWACRIVTFCDNSTAVSSMQNIIDYLKDGKSTYFHCSVGADRTGTVAFLALALLGVGEDALSKDFELSSFYDNPDEVMLRMRTNDRYDYAGMMKKLYSMSGDNLQRKVYNYFKNGIGGKKVSEEDLDWYINYMIGYQPVTKVTLDVAKLQMESGETHQLEAAAIPQEAAGTITFKSSDEAVATVSETGLITALRGGTATITASVSDELKGTVSSSVTVTIPLIETAMPETIEDNGTIWQTKRNMIKNGSFEYAGYFSNWTNAKKLPLSGLYFDVMNYSEESNAVYIQSKSDTDAGTLRAMWYIDRGKTYAFGYKVKNTSGKTVEHNSNLVTRLTNSSTVRIGGEGDDFEWDEPEQSSMRAILKDAVSKDENAQVLEYPSYDGQWTEIVYIFTNTDGYQYLEMFFSHLSQDGDNTCFDDFFLTQLEDVTAGVPSVDAKVGDGRYYNLSGQEIAVPGKGLYIRDGRKYYNQ